jgi:hypothetical protein
MFTSINEEPELPYQLLVLVEDDMEMEDDGQAFDHEIKSSDVRNMELPCSIPSTVVNLPGDEFEFEADCH